jgi:hypothetical protein
MTPGTSLSVFALSPSNEFAATVAAMLDGGDGVRFRSRLGGLDGTQEEFAQATERADVLLIDSRRMTRASSASSAGSSSRRRAVGR